MNKPPSTPFARQLVALLAASDISRKELAARIGRSEPAISQWIHKGDMPDLSLALRLEEALEVPLGTFVKLVDPDAWAILRRRQRVDAATWAAECEEFGCHDPLSDPTA